MNEPFALDRDVQYSSLDVPTFDDLRKNKETDVPSMHYQFRYGDCLCCIRRVRRRYAVCCRGFLPLNYSSVDSFGNWLVVFVTTDFVAAKIRYRSLVLEVLDLEPLDDTQEPASVLIY